MLPPCGVCFAICCAAAWTAKNAPFKFVPIVKLTRSGDILGLPSTRVVRHQALIAGNSRQKVREFAYACVAHEYVQSPKLFHGLCDQILSCFWFSDVSRYADNFAAGISCFCD
jgi:hypothetical protein